MYQGAIARGREIKGIAIVESFRISCFPIFEGDHFGYLEDLGDLRRTGRWSQHSVLALRESCLQKRRRIPPDSAADFPATCVELYCFICGVAAKQRGNGYDIIFFSQ